MQSKAKWIAGISTTFGSQSILIPTLSSKDSDFTSITFAGSSSLFELFETLGDRVKNITAKKFDFNKVDLSILPTGSAWGREALKDKKIILALTSTKPDNSIYGKPQANIVSNLLSLFSNSTQYLTTNDPIRSWNMADDSIDFFVVNNKSECFKKINSGTSNKWGDKYRDNVVAILSDGKQPEGSSGWFVLKSNSIEMPCFNEWVGYSREGSSKRSSLNKTIFGYKDKETNYLKIREIPENSFFALDFLRRESFRDSIFAFTKSFFEKNKNYFKNLGLTNTGLSASSKRDLKFEIEKKEVENKHLIRTWLNSLLVNSYEFVENNFHLNRTATYWDPNHQCITGGGGDAWRVYDVTGYEEGIDERTKLPNHCPPKKY